METKELEETIRNLKISNQIYYFEIDKHKQGVQSSINYYYNGNMTSKELEEGFSEKANLIVTLEYLIEENDKKIQDFLNELEICNFDKTERNITNSNSI